MKKTFTILFTLLIFLAKGYCQDAASSTWGLLNLSTEASISGQLQNSSFQVQGVTVKDAGGPDGCIRITKTTTWHTSESDDYYIEFSVEPKTGALFSASKISFLVGGSGGGNVRANFYYSKDPTFAQRTQIPFKVDLDITRDKLDTCQVDIDENISSGEKIYFRVYPYYKTASTGKHICLKDVSISGTTTSTSVDVAVIWPFISDTNPVVSGSLIANNMTFGSYASIYQYSTSYTTLNNAAIQNGTFATKTSNCAWTGSSDIQDSIYAQFAVAPKAGGTLTVDSISLMISAYATNDMLAAVYLSKDPAFATKILVKPNTSLINKELQQWGILLNDPQTISTGETLYMRVYPYNTANATWKLVSIRNFTVNGSLIGATADPAEVTTLTSVSYISTSGATSGGTISNDGGASVTARGVAWSTSQNPTIEDSKTSDGEGAGTFTSTLTELSAGTTYYLRAYATNKAGTSYGDQVSFQTLAELALPTVSTTGSSEILNTSFIVAGNVSDWGGTEVSEKGFAYGTSEQPTVNDNKIVAGSGLGSFSGFINKLSPQTVYYVRAYAINSTGLSYGSQISITTKATDPDVTKIISGDGTGDYTNVQAAFDAVPTNYTGKWIIRIKPGTYEERPSLAKNKINVYLVGEDPYTTVISNNVSAGTAKPEGGMWGTSNCQTVEILANDFVAMNVTIANTFINSAANTAINANTQAVALKTQGDRQAFYNCRITGYQDTYLGNSIGRAYFKNCYIEGNVDFIFGRQTVIFDQCTTYVNREGSVIVAPSTESTTLYGMVFLDCKLTAPSLGTADFNGSAFNSFYYGRPWQQRPKAAFIRCETPSSLNEKGWTTMNGGLNPVFVEYGCTGDGATAERLAKRTNEGKVISETEAAEYTISHVFKKETDPSFVADWMPSPSIDLETSSVIPNPSKSMAAWIYPNPVISDAVINYNLAEESHVVMTFFDVKGSLVRKMDLGLLEAGSHSVALNAAQFTSGIYFFHVEMNGAIVNGKFIKK